MRLRIEKGLTFDSTSTAHYLDRIRRIHDILRMAEAERECPKGLRTDGASRDDCQRKKLRDLA
jgi:hypothetical protein